MDQRRYWKEKDDDPEVDVQRMKVVREALGFCGEEPSLLYGQIPHASKARGKGKLVRSPFTLHVVATTLMIGASPGVRDQATRFLRPVRRGVDHLSSPSFGLAQQRS